MIHDICKRMGAVIVPPSETMRGNPVSRNVVPRIDRFTFFSNTSEEAIIGRQSSTVSFPIMRAGIIIEWRRNVHQSEGTEPELRPAGIHSIHRISLRLSPGRPSCCPKLLAISRRLGSSGLVGRDLRNRLKPWLLAIALDER